jgi:hypothetical protein
MTKDPAVCEDGQPLTLDGVEVYKLGKDAKIDFKTWAGTGGSSYSLSVKAGVVSTASGSIY